MRYIKFLLVPMLFGSLAFMNIGGCGGSGGGGNNGGGGGLCQMPRLTNDFSDRAYFFVDVIRDLDLGVTSTSDVVFFTISDVDGLAFVADVVSDNDCVVTGVTDGEFVLPATGICER